MPAHESFSSDHALQLYFIADMSGVGRIVIGMEREKAQELAVAVRYGAHALRDTKTVNPLVPRPASREDSFPSESRIAVQLFPFQLANFSKRGSDRQCLGPVERKPCFLE
jgi:hypothetical protein